MNFVTNEAEYERIDVNVVPMLTEVSKRTFTHTNLLTGYTYAVFGPLFEESSVVTLYSVQEVLYRKYSA